MSLRDKVGAAVDEALAAGVVGGRIEVESGGGRFVMESRLVTPVGISCEWMTYSRGVPVRAGGVGSWGKALVERLSYLTERVVLVEADEELGGAVARSEAPARAREGIRSYYELRFDSSGTVRLSRVVYDEGARVRRDGEIQLTREVLERLCDDFEGWGQMN